MSRSPGPLLTAPPSSSPAATISSLVRGPSPQPPPPTSAAVFASTATIISGRSSAPGRRLRHPRLRRRTSQHPRCAPGQAVATERRRRHAPFLQLCRVRRNERVRRAPCKTKNLEPGPELSGRMRSRQSSSTLIGSPSSQRIPHLIPQPPQAQLLLNAYLLEKALYELLYELDNRQAWIRIPLAGILTLLQ